MKKNDFRSQMLPYCLKKMDDDIGGWIVLNRDYKPFNHDSDKGWAIYENIPANSRIKKLTLKQIELLSWYKEEINTDLPFVYLYSDASIPTSSNINWNKYSEKLKRLATYMTIRS